MLNLGTEVAPNEGEISPALSSRSVKSCATARPNACYCSLPLLLLPSVLVRFIPPFGSRAGSKGGDLRGSVVVKENCRIVGDSGSVVVAVGGGDGGRRRS